MPSVLFLAFLLPQLKLLLLFLFPLFTGAGFPFLFALLSFLSVQILCRVVVLHHKGRLRHLKEKHPEESAQEILDRLER